MKILYVAPGIKIEGMDGGAVHTWEVSQGLKELGHQVHLIVKGNRKAKKITQLKEGVTIYYVLKWLPAKLLQWLTFPRIYNIARKIRPDVIIERYYNFAGGGILSAHLLKIPCILEVNSPVIDHPGSVKAFIDALLIFKPMKKWREALCRWSNKIITPLPAILPVSVPDKKVVKISWGANINHFSAIKHDVLALRKKLNIKAEAKVFVFIGSFRTWHGLPDLIEAGNHICKEHGRTDLLFLLIGGGPEAATIQHKIKKLGLDALFLFLGKIPHQEMPAYLALAKAGIAPFNTRFHKQLKLGFYWSPLKIFEFMASGLPVITIDIPPLNEIVEHQQEGLLFQEGNSIDLAEKILALADNDDLVEKMGYNARRKVEKNYSWQVHCQKLDSIMKELVKNR
jgi:starch synthase